MHKTLVQWHGSEKRDERGNVLPVVFHQAGEIADLSHEPDLGRLEREGVVVEVGEATLPTKPPEIPFQPAHDVPPTDGGEAVG